MDRCNKKTVCLVISGIDGSGKTTIIKSLQENLNKEGYKTAYIWLRFNHYLAKILHAFARIVGLSVKVNNEMGTVWQHQFYKSPAFSSLYIFFTWLDTFISKFKYNKIAKGNDIVICDRWVTDILIDLATKTHREDFLESKWPKRFFKILPADHRLFVIFRDTKELVDCRLENRTDPDFLFRLKMYDKLLKSTYVVGIDNRGSIESSVNQIINNIYD